MLELPGSEADQPRSSSKATRSLPPTRVDCALGALMSANHWSLSEVARRCGLPRLTVRKWRDNRVTAYSRRVLVRLCKGLEVEIGSLLVLTDGSRKARTTRSARRVRQIARRVPRPVARR